jgi:hypothetical protein
MWPLWRLALCLETCGELTETQEVSPVNSLKVLDVQNGWENQVPRGPALLHRSLLGVFPRIELTTSEISLIRLQKKRFIDLKEINFATCFVKRTCKRYLKIERSLQHLKEINFVPCFVTEREIARYLEIERLQDLLLIVNKEF